VFPACIAPFVKLLFISVVVAPDGAMLRLVHCAWLQAAGVVLPARIWFQDAGDTPPYQRRGPGRCEGCRD
jgi:hypothetical protein